MAYTWFILLLVVSGTALMLLLCMGLALGSLVHDEFQIVRGGAFCGYGQFLSDVLPECGEWCIASRTKIPPFHFVIMMAAMSSSGIRIIILLAWDMRGWRRLELGRALRRCW